MNPVLLAVLAALVGFVAGALLSASLTSEARAVEGRVRLIINSVVLDWRGRLNGWVADTKATFAYAKKEIARVEADAEAKRAQLEKDAKASFEVFSNDVEAIVKRLEALEQHVDQKICSVINPGGQS